MKGREKEKLKCSLKWTQVYLEKVQRLSIVTKWEEKRTLRWTELKDGKRNARRWKKMRSLWSGEEGEFLLQSIDLA